ncbi:hypothetical protein [Halobellus clavatus]|uniref:Uncharacterized protein n=1 Tax=Halobellus clavatus TaxID=660517 RepID=A0A1H3KHC6_9EURY|nr:hypothetical protein [Halobellus clavatus]SDY51449.1 hypothetical protein SAMN04487946_11954 [Halobellus clavatus]
MSDELSTSDILGRAEEALHSAKMGLEDVRDGPPHKNSAGVKNVATYGRATTRILSRLSSRENEFDKWWSKFAEEMGNDPLMQYFWDLRNQALKQEGVDFGWELKINYFSTDMLSDNEKPENAQGFVIGDSQHGGLGWEVELPSGETTIHYIDPPSELVESSPVLPDPPQEHLGEDITDANAAEMCQMYIDYLENILYTAKAKFGE